MSGQQLGRTLKIKTLAFLIFYLGTACYLAWEVVYWYRGGHYPPLASGGNASTYITVLSAILVVVAAWIRFFLGVTPRLELICISLYWALQTGGPLFGYFYGPFAGLEIIPSWEILLPVFLISCGCLIFLWRTR